MNQHTDSQLHRNAEQDIRQSPQVKRSRRKRRRRLQRLSAWLLVIVLIVALAAAVISLYIVHGGRSLRERTAGVTPNLDMEQAEMEEQGSYVPQVGNVWKEGWVRYQDKIYEYNEDILTFLVMGIDKMEKY